MFDRTFIVKKVEDDDLFYRKFHVDSTGTFMKGRKEPKPQPANKPHHDNHSDKADRADQPRLANPANRGYKASP